MDARRDDPAVLTDGQRQVLRLAGEGLTNRGIAERLHISVSAVKRHLEQAFARLGIHDRHKAAQWLARAEEPPHHGEDIDPTTLALNDGVLRRGVAVVCAVIGSSSGLTDIEFPMVTLSGIWDHRQRRTQSLTRPVRLLTPSRGVRLAPTDEYLIRMTEESERTWLNRSEHPHVWRMGAVHVTMKFAQYFLNKEIISVVDRILVDGPRSAELVSEDFELFLAAHEPAVRDWLPFVVTTANDNPSMHPDEFEPIAKRYEKDTTSWQLLWALFVAAQEEAGRKFELGGESPWIEPPIVTRLGLEDDESSDDELDDQT